MEKNEHKKLIEIKPDLNAENDDGKYFNQDEGKSKNKVSFQNK